MITEKDLKQHAIDLSPLGLGAGSRTSDFLCTPKRARVLGWEGADGVHYCTVPELGETVFAVSPLNAPETVHPIAKNLEDLLRLLLACGHTAALEQAHGWDHAQFDAFLAENPAAPEQRAVLNRIRAEFGLTPMEEPYRYLKALQRDFDPSVIPWRREYLQEQARLRETKVPEEPEWAVFFHGGFWGSPHDRSRPGQEVPIRRQAAWGAHILHIPAVYLCGKGLVMEVCIEADRENTAAFLRKYGGLERDTSRELSQEETERIELESPLALDFRVHLTLNGRELREMHGCGTVWIPPELLPEGERPDPNAWRVLEHYGLDPGRVWILQRIAFPWAGPRKPADLRTLEATFTEVPRPLPGPHFRVQTPGDRISFTHPLTGAEHTLTVTEYEPQTMDPSHMDPAWDYPTHYTALCAAVEPPLPPQTLTLRDCSQGDRPRRKVPEKPMAPKAACSVGVILGGADSPTAILIDEKPAQVLTAASSLRFEALEALEWQMVFQSPCREPVRLSLLP